MLVSLSVLSLLLPGNALAQENPAPEPTPSVALSDSDEALLDALLVLLSDQDAATGARSLGALADPRALWVLSYSVTTRAPRVAAAAARALGAFPQASDDLAAWVNSTVLADDVRVAAAQALTQAGQRGGAQALIAALGDRRNSVALRERLHTVLAQAWPDQVARADSQVVQDGTALLMLGTMPALGYSLAATGHFGGTGLEPLGALTGAAGGATLGFVLGRTRPVEAGQAAFFSTSGITGLTTGTLLGVWADPYSGDGPWIGGLLGGALGYGVGLAGWREYQGTPGDALLASGVGLAGGALFSSTASLVVSNGVALPEEATVGLFGLGLAGGLAVGHLTAPGRDLSGDDVVLGLAGMTYGAFLGTALPAERWDRAGLPVAIASGGSLLVYGLAPVIDVPTDVSGGGLTGLGFGAVIGGGLGMLMDPGGSSNIERSGVTLGGTLGAALGTGLAYHVDGPLHLDDAVLTGLTTGWATWQTVGWASLFEPDPKLTGLLVMAPAVAGAGTAAASPLFTVQFGDSLSATSLGLWGAYLGTVSGQLAHRGGDTTLGLALGASDVGLLGGALLMSPVVDASPTVVGVADAGGVLGGSTAALVTALFTDQTDPMLAASLVGSGLGAAGGALVGRVLDRQSARGTDGGTADATVVHRLGISGWPRRVVVQPAWIPHDDTGSFGLRASLSAW